MTKTIMVIDDSESMRQIIRIGLQGAGYEVLEAGDGVDALNKLKGQKVSLFLCDVNMPNMDGITFVKELKRSPHYKFSPVVMLTTETQDAKKEQGKLAGAKAWMTKPFKSDQLLAVVKKLVLP